jgi:hypothetical protein
MNTSRKVFAVIGFIFILLIGLAASGAFGASTVCPKNSRGYGPYCSNAHRVNWKRFDKSAALTSRDIALRQVTAKGYCFQPRPPLKAGEYAIWYHFNAKGHCFSEMITGPAKPAPAQKPAPRATRKASGK